MNDDLAALLNRALYAIAPHVTRAIGRTVDFVLPRLPWNNCDQQTAYRAGYAEGLQDGLKIGAGR